MRLHRSISPTLFLLLSIFYATGCGVAPPASHGGFDSPDPASKLYAITRAGEQEEESAIPHLIEQLHSDDQAVRLYAIGALERITGERMGYVWYDPLHRRNEAIKRWVAAYESGGLNPDEDAASAAKE